MSLAEKTSEILQYINTVVACSSSIFIHGYIIRRIKLNATSFTNYRNFLVLQSTVYIVGSVLGLILNERTTLKLEDRTGYPFFVLPSWLTSVISAACDFIDVGEVMLLTLFNIHRVLIFSRPRKIGLLYIIGLPIAFFGSILVGVLDAFFQDISYYSSCTYYAVTLTIVLVCYFILRRHFRLNNYSIVVRKAQNKMSKGLLIQIFVQTTTLGIMSIGPIISLVASLFRLSESTADEVLGIYMVIYVVFLWFSVLIGFIIKWSISGLLTIKQSHRPSRVPNEMAVVKAKENIET
uniref:G_PROTEIN_RECEP_F1_2 domain-containing protein n=1 Tax=Haemonchus contortus TaxID=6289 RepID=A0A7I4YD20_HAECO